MGSVPARHLGRKVGASIKEHSRLYHTVLTAVTLTLWHGVFVHGLESNAAVLIAAGACMRSGCMRCREEELAEAKTGAEGRAQGRDERAVWMAHAETAVASPARRALWSDSQFHILEMQTGTPHRSPATRSSSSCHCVAITPDELHTQDACQKYSWCN